MQDYSIRLAKALGTLKFIEMVREIENDQAKRRRENLYVRLAVWLRWFGMVGVNIMSWLATDIPQYNFWLGMFISLSIGYLISSIFTTRRAGLIWMRQFNKLDGVDCPDEIVKIKHDVRETFDKMMFEFPYIISNIVSCGFAIRNILILG